MTSEGFDDQVSGIAALEHPMSRRAYQLVRERGWVTRDAAADALDVARSVAAFHLDKLAEAGLLDVKYERTSGRTGPGAGRPAKLYGRSDREIDVTIPPRRYDLAGALLADAIALTVSERVPVESAVSTVARQSGERLGGEARAERKSAPRTTLLRVLTRQGYEPQKNGRDIALVNCPFHSLANEHRELVCGMNLDFLEGVSEGIEPGWFDVRLDPEPGWCCVRICAR